jgi:hypothetical protein
MVDLFKDPALVKRIKEDFKNNKTNSSYDPRIPAGPPSLN